MLAAAAQPAIVFQHGIEQDLRAGGAVFNARPLGFIVRNAAAARHEDHGRRRHARDIDRIVGGAGDDVTVRVPRGFNGDADAIDQVRRKVQTDGTSCPAFVIDP